MMIIPLSAMALMLAAPAAGEPVPATERHAGHATMDHAAHGQHGDDCKKCCEKAKQAGAKMNCTEHRDDKPSSGASAEKDGHAAH